MAKKIKIKSKKPVVKKYDFNNIPDSKPGKVRPAGRVGGEALPPKPKTPGSNNVAEKLRNLIRDTGSIADRKTTANYSPGNAIEAEMIRKETPPVQEPAAQTTQQQTASSAIPAGDNDAVAHMLNGAAMIVGDKVLKKVPEQCVITEAQMKEIHSLQPNGGIQVQSWGLYIAVAVSMIAMNTMAAKNKEAEKGASMESLIAAMEAKGYKITPPAEDLMPLIEKLRKHGFKIEKGENMQDVTFTETQGGKIVDIKTQQGA